MAGRTTNRDSTVRPHVRDVVEADQAFPDKPAPSQAPLEPVLSAPEIELLLDGEQAFPAWLSAIASATREIVLDMYWFASDKIGWRFAEALAERAANGVSVRVMVDAVGSLGTSSAMFDHMRKAGVQIGVYHPLAILPSRTAWTTLWRRDHRKILVVDGAEAFTGGINITDYSSPVSWGGGGWRDTAVRVRGPAALVLLSLFLKVWNALHRSKAPITTEPDLASPHVAVVGHGLPGARRAIRNRYVRAIRNARKRVWIANAYFVPDRRVRRALAIARKNGVDVRILVPARSDVKLVQHASHSLYERLLVQGTRIFEWQPSMMHAKTAVLDDWGVVGSYNLDYRSLRSNLEVTVASDDAAFVDALATSFENDLTSCAEIHLDSWRTRGLFHRLVDWFCMQFERLT